MSTSTEQSSSKASTIAGKVLAGETPTASEIRTLAASVLSQDEIQGQTLSQDQTLSQGQTQTQAEGQTGTQNQSEGRRS